VKPLSFELIVRVDQWAGIEDSCAAVRGSLDRLRIPGQDGLWGKVEDEHTSILLVISCALVA
jgi:hypothetical protein